MRIVRFDFVVLDGEAVTQDEAAAIHDALWAHANPDMKFEHITVTSVVDRLEIVFFLPHDVENPRGRVERFLGLNMSGCPALARWRVDTTA
jgi:hypothetical protein